MMNLTKGEIMFLVKGGQGKSSWEVFESAAITIVASLAAIIGIIVAAVI